MLKTLLLKNQVQVSRNDQEHLSGGQRIEDLLNVFRRHSDMITIAGDTDAKVLINSWTIFNTLSRIIFIQSFSETDDVGTQEFKDVTLT